MTTQKTTLPEGWTLSEETITVIVNYDDPRWSSIPKQGGKYCYVNPSLTPQDFSKGGRTGKWEVTFRWLMKRDGANTGQALKAITASGDPGANRPETESVIDAHPQNLWAGFGVHRDFGMVPVVYSYDDGERALSLHASSGYWSENSRFLVSCEWRPVD